MEDSASSVVLAIGSTVAGFSGDNVMAWVLLVLNIITLATRMLIPVYRAWRDRDKDIDNKDGDCDEK